jgi:hypothetical protein
MNVTEIKCKHVGQGYFAQYRQTLVQITSEDINHELCSAYFVDSREAISLSAHPPMQSSPQQNQGDITKEQ